MKIAFFQPPTAQSLGGIAAALRPLEATLQGLGHEIVRDLEGQPEVVHFHGLWQRPHLKLARTCRERGIPYLVSPHGMLEPWAFRSKRWKKHPYFYLLERPFLRKAAAVLGTSQLEVKNLRAKLSTTHLVALPLGLTDSARPAHQAARQALSFQPEEKILLYLSRIDRKKGLDILLRALAATPLTSARLVVVGGGDPTYLQECRHLAETHAHDLPPIDWMGEVWGQERWPFLQAADLFCLPTHSENFGLAVLEALQVGTPVLTTCQTPWPSLMAGVAGGYFCRPEVESVASALVEFAKAPAWADSDRSVLANWAHSQFSWDKLAQDYEALYREVASRRG